MKITVSALLTLSLTPLMAHAGQLTVEQPAVGIPLILETDGKRTYARLDVERHKERVVMAGRALTLDAQRSEAVLYLASGQGGQGRPSQEALKVELHFSKSVASIKRGSAKLMRTVELKYKGERLAVLKLSMSLDLFGLSSEQPYVSIVEGQAVTLLADRAPLLGAQLRFPGTFAMPIAKLRMPVLRTSN